MSTKREPGYYFVIHKGKEIIAECKGSGWALPGSHLRYVEESFSSIGERVERVKDSVSVPVGTFKCWVDLAHRYNAGGRLTDHMKSYLPEPPKTNEI